MRREKGKGEKRDGGGRKEVGVRKWEMAGLMGKWEEEGGVKGMLKERYEYCMYVFISYSFTKTKRENLKKIHYSNRPQTYLETNIVESHRFNSPADLLRGEWFSEGSSCLFAELFRAIFRFNIFWHLYIIHLLN